MSTDAAFEFDWSADAWADDLAPAGDEPVTHQPETLPRKQREYDYEREGDARLVAWGVGADESDVRTEPGRPRKPVQRAQHPTPKRLDTFGPPLTMVRPTVRDYLLRSATHAYAIVDRNHAELGQVLREASSIVRSDRLPLPRGRQTWLWDLLLCAGISESRARAILTELRTATGETMPVGDLNLAWLLDRRCTYDRTVDLRHAMRTVRIAAAERAYSWPGYPFPFHPDDPKHRLGIRPEHVTVNALPSTLDARRSDPVFDEWAWVNVDRATPRSGHDVRRAVASGVAVRASRNARLDPERALTRALGSENRRRTLTVMAALLQHVTATHEQLAALLGDDAVLTDWSSAGKYLGLLEAAALVRYHSPEPMAGMPKPRLYLVELDRDPAAYNRLVNRLSLVEWQAVTGGEPRYTAGTNGRRHNVTALELQLRFALAGQSAPVVLGLAGQRNARLGQLAGDADSHTTRIERAGHRADATIFARYTTIGVELTMPGARYADLLAKAALWMEAMYVAPRLHVVFVVAGKPSRAGAPLADLNKIFTALATRNLARWERVAHRFHVTTWSDWFEPTGLGLTGAGRELRAQHPSADIRESAVAYQVDTRTVEQREIREEAYEDELRTVHLQFAPNRVAMIPGHIDAPWEPGVWARDASDYTAFAALAGMPRLA